MSFWLEKQERRALANMQESIKKHGYPDPEIFITQWGYQKARCPECEKECLIAGYVQHYNRSHDPETKYPSRKGEKYHQSVVDQRYIEPVDEAVWHARHKESMDRILKRHS